GHGREAGPGRGPLDGGLGALVAATCDDGQQRDERAGGGGEGTRTGVHHVLLLHVACSQRSTVNRLGRDELSREAAGARPPVVAAPLQMGGSRTTGCPAVEGEQPP